MLLCLTTYTWVCGAVRVLPVVFQCRLQSSDFSSGIPLKGSFNYFSSGVPVYPAIFAGSTRGIPVYTGSTSGIPMYTGPASVHWLRVRVDSETVNVLLRSLIRSFWGWTFSCKIAPSISSINICRWKFTDYSFQGSCPAETRKRNIELMHWSSTFSNFHWPHAYDCGSHYPN